MYDPPTPTCATNRALACSKMGQQLCGGVLWHLALDLW